MRRRARIDQLGTGAMSAPPPTNALALAEIVAAGCAVLS